MRLSCLIAAVVAGVSLATFAYAQQSTYDIVIYGGTSGGAAAAIQSARMGKSVVLIEPTNHVGGLTVSGLGHTDVGNKNVIGGIARDFYRNIRRYYDNKKVWIHQKPEEHALYSKNEDALWQFEPHVAEKVLGDMLAEAKVKVVLNQRLDLKNGVKKDGARILAITMESGQSFAGTVFIDATYEGDLMAKAGVSYIVGREDNNQYGETLNGNQQVASKKHQFIKPVDPYRVPGDPASGLLPGIESGGAGIEGAGDKRVQAYNFRMCLTTVTGNRIPFPKPDGYDPQQYELLLRNFEAGDLRIPFTMQVMPNNKTDSNNNFAVSTDDIGQNYDFAEADYARRDEIIRAHRVYQQGLMWTLANHPRVPEEVRSKAAQYGLAKDEFVDNNNWPYQLYIREARRMISDYVVTEQDCRHQRFADDSIGMASYQMDSHHVRRYVDETGHVRNEGDIQVRPTGPYAIAYRALVPRAGECTNLLVPVCLSATHIAYGSIRMEPVFMVLGQSAATAAAMSIDQKVGVQAVSYSDLRRRLLADHQVLSYKNPEPAEEGKQP